MEKIAIRSTAYKIIPFILLLALTIANVVAVFYNINSKYWFEVYLTTLCFLSLFLIWSFFRLFSPKIAIYLTEDGLLIKKLFSKKLYPFKDLYYATAKEENSEHRARLGLIQFFYNKNLDVGTLRVRCTEKGFPNVITLRNIINANSTANKINDILKERKK